MKPQLIKVIREHVELFRCNNTGIAWVEDGRTGNGHSAHANIDASGSVKGMKSRGYWKPDARTARTHGFIYNIDTVVIDSDLDKIAAEHCRCEACQKFKSKCQKIAERNIHDVFEAIKDSCSSYSEARRTVQSMGALSYDKKVELIQRTLRRR